MKNNTVLAWGLVCAALAAGLSVEKVFAAETSQVPPVVVGGKIAYVMSARHWALYQAPGGKEIGGSAECPNGFNDGPREEFAKLYPGNQPRTLQDTVLKRQGAQWFPDTDTASLMFREVSGNIAYGMNLDGKIGPHDFTSPDGEKGIDNQLYRAIGCISMYRENGTIYDLENDNVTRHRFNRVVIEISDVDSLINDDDVTVRSYRGLDNLLSDSKGNALPGGSQHIDNRWGKFFQATWKGKIVNGVLITEPADFEFGATADGGIGTAQFKGLRFQLKLTSDRAGGLMAGYTDIEHFYRELIEGWTTHYISYGQVPAAPLDHALKRLADGYPDPKTGKPTAISAAINAEFVRVSVINPPSKVAVSTQQSRATRVTQ